jgi:hypothetical protein
MSSLLDGIDVAESGSSKSSGGPNPKVIKGAIAGVLFLLAGVVLAMNFGIIPPIWGSGDAVKNKSGEEVVYTPPSEEEVRKINEKLEQEQAEFIRRGGSIGGS